jgi:hypothetical protein
VGSEGQRGEFLGSTFTSWVACVVVTGIPTTLCPGGAGDSTLFLILVCKTDQTDNSGVNQDNVWGIWFSYKTTRQTCLEFLLFWAKKSQTDKKLKLYGLLSGAMSDLYTRPVWRSVKPLLFGFAQNNMYISVRGLTASDFCLAPFVWRPVWCLKSSKPLNKTKMQDMSEFPYLKSRQDKKLDSLVLCVLSCEAWTAGRKPVGLSWTDRHEG